MTSTLKSILKRTQDKPPQDRQSALTIVITCAKGLKSECSLSTEVVAQYGLFRILLGSMSVTNIAEKSGPYGPPLGTIYVGIPDWQPGMNLDSYGLRAPSQNGGDALLTGSATGFKHITH